MSVNASTEKSPGDTIKMGIAVAILLAAVYGYYHFADSSQLFRVLGVVGAVIVALLVAAQTVTGRGVMLFMADARTETRKVVWPTKQETMQVTMVVLFMVILVGLILWGLDSLLGWAIQALLGT
jgi:preprotein translocase subunit SecE